LALTTPSRL